MKKIALTLFAILTLLNARSQTSYSFGVRIVGRGKPMLLIPGMKGSADTYNDVVAHYKNHYKCYIITLAGFAGQPPSGAHDHLLLKQRDDIIRFIIDQHLHRPVLVGFSFGAGLAMWVACTRPDLMGRFIDLDGTPFDAAVDVDRLDKDSLVKADGSRYEKLVSRSPDFWRKRDSAFHSPASEQEGFIYLQKLVSDTNRVREIMVWDKASDFRSAVLMDLESDTLDMRESVANIKSPILLLGSWRGYDYIKTKAEAEKRYAVQFAKAKNLTTRFSENGKHFLMYDDYDWMIGEMDKFLAKN